MGSKQRQYGFTLLELMVVTAIMGVLMDYSIPLMIWIQAGTAYLPINGLDSTNTSSVLLMALSTSGGDSMAHLSPATPTY